MNYIVKKATFLSIFFLSIIGGAAAQDAEQEYLAEIGVQAGANVYTGDVNTIARKSFFSENINKAQLDLGAFFRYKFNPRFALRLGYDRTGVKGVYPYANAGETYDITLNNTEIGAIDLWGEYNFFDYEKSKYKRYSKTFSPYIFAGMGYLNMPNSETERKSALTLPFGVGIKFILAPRWNLNIQWTNRLLFGDNLEGLPEYDNPVPNTKGNFMNNDLLSGLTVGVSFDFFRKPCDCNAGIYKASKPRSYKTPRNNNLPRKR